MLNRPPREPRATPRLVEAVLRAKGSADPARSLRARLTLGAGAMALALAFILSTIIGEAARREVADETGERLRDAAAQTVDKLDRAMFERYREIQVVASLDQIAEPSVPLPAKQRLLDRLQQTYADYAWIGLADPDGRVVVSTAGLFRGDDVSDRAWFRGGTTGPYVGEVREGATGDPTGDAQGRDTTRFVDTAMPVRDSSGAFRGVLGAHLYWSWAREVERSLIRPVAEQEKVDLVVLSRDGTVLLGDSARIGRTITVADITGRGTDKSGHLTADWPDGRSYLTGYAVSQGYRTYPGLGWTVVVRDDVEGALAPARELQERILLIGLTLGLLFALLALVVARRIARPIEAIASAAEAIRLGKGTEIPLIAADDEVGHLSRSLHGLVDSLRTQREELRALNEQLETRVEERTRQLAAANAELGAEIRERTKAEEALQAANEEADRARHAAEEANQTKSTFLSRMSHDLRTPLNAILGFSQLLELDELTTEQQENVALISQAGKDLLQLVNEILDVARIEAGELSLSVERIPLRPVIEEALELVEPLASKRSVRLLDETRGLEHAVMADGYRLRQVVRNLVSHTIRMTAEGGTATLRVEDRTPGRTRLAVRGSRRHPGDADAARNERDWAKHDDGVGLSLSRRLAEAMNGELGVANGRQTIDLWLELDGALSASVPTTGVEHRDRPRPRALSARTGPVVLYIEDDPVNRRLIDRVLHRQEGVTVIPAATGTEGIELAQAHRPDLILLDLHLPDMTGLAALEQLRAADATRRIPVVVLSGDVTPARIDQLRRAGVSDFLEKPIQVDRLSSVVGPLLAGRAVA